MKRSSESTTTASHIFDCHPSSSGAPDENSTTIAFHFPSISTFSLPFAIPFPKHKQQQEEEERQQWVIKTNK
jgi:hypothetical protein